MEQLQNSCSVSEFLGILSQYMESRRDEPKEDDLLSKNDPLKKTDPLTAEDRMLNLARSQYQKINPEWPEDENITVYISQQLSEVSKMHPLGSSPAKYIVDRQAEIAIPIRGNGSKESPLVAATGMYEDLSSYLASSLCKYAELYEIDIYFNLIFGNSLVTYSCTRDGIVIEEQRKGKWD